jgi:predicted dinucleotide-binding enzyme
MKISILGTGSVGQTLASRLAALKYDVMIGTRNVSEKLAGTEPDGRGNPSFSEWYKGQNGIGIGTFSESAAFGEIVINATHGGSSIASLKLAGAKNLAGKILMDIANPLDFSKGMPPSLIPGLCNTSSLGEEIQSTFPYTLVVKTLNTMWSGLMVNPGMIGGGDHINYICGNDIASKNTVRKLLNQFGWKDENILDIGDITGARASESVLPIWLRVMQTYQSGVFNFRVVR